MAQFIIAIELGRISSPIYNPSNQGERITAHMCMPVFLNGDFPLNHWHLQLPQLSSFHWQEAIPMNIPLMNS